MAAALRLHIQGLGTAAVGLDQPFGSETTSLEVLPIKDYAEAGQRRRFGRLAKLVYVAASRALDDAGIADPSALAVVTGTAMGEVAVSLELLGQIHATRGKTVGPALLPNAVHNSPAGYLTIGKKIRGPALTVSQGWLSAEAALDAAADLLEAGQGVERVLIAVGDEANPAWIEALRGAGAAALAEALAQEKFQEGAVAAVVGLAEARPGMGMVAAGVVRPVGGFAGSLRALLADQGVSLGREALVQVRARSADHPLCQAARDLLPDPQTIEIDNSGAQAGGLVALCRHLRQGQGREALFLSVEVEEIGFIHYCS